MNSRLTEKAPHLILFFVACSTVGLLVLTSLVGKIFSPSLITNFHRVFSDEQMHSALSNTILLCFLSVAFQSAVATMVTIHFHRVPNIIKVLLAVPFATGIVAPAFSMFVLFSPSIGPFNSDILGTVWGGRTILVLIDSWQWVGILLLACFLILEKIPESHFEQARLERIPLLRRWWFISRPQLQPVFGIFFLLRLIDWFRKVDLIQALFGSGGAGHFAETIGIFIQRIYFQSGDEGYAALLSIFQVIILGMLLLLVVQMSKRVLSTINN